MGLIRMNGPCRISCAEDRWGQWIPRWSVNKAGYVACQRYLDIMEFQNYKLVENEATKLVAKECGRRLVEAYGEKAFSNTSDSDAILTAKVRCKVDPKEIFEELAKEHEGDLELHFQFEALRYSISQMDRLLAMSYSTVWEMNLLHKNLKDYMRVCVILGHSHKHKDGLGSMQRWTWKDDIRRMYLIPYVAVKNRWWRLKDRILRLFGKKGYGEY